MTEIKVLSTKEKEEEISDSDCKARNMHGFLEYLWTVRKETS